jgi:hypothetical protein
MKVIDVWAKFAAAIPDTFVEGLDENGVREIELEGSADPATFLAVTVKLYKVPSVRYKNVADPSYCCNIPSLGVHDISYSTLAPFPDTTDHVRYAVCGPTYPERSVTRFGPAAAVIGIVGN